MVNKESLLRNKIIRLFELLLMRYIGENPDKKDIKKLCLRASSIMQRYGFDYVIPEINFKGGYIPEERGIYLAFRPLGDVMCDDPDPWIEVKVDALCCL